MIHVAGDNDIGGEWMDSITQNLVSRFSQHFGSINEIIEIKSFQIVKVRKPISKIKKKSVWLIETDSFPDISLSLAYSRQLVAVDKYGNSTEEIALTREEKKIRDIGSHFLP